MMKEMLWQVKVAARIHDPAEKALVLLRDPAGHEGGTSDALARLLGQYELQSDKIAAGEGEALTQTVFREGLPADLYRIVQRADWWAAAADRPQWPLERVTVTTQQGEKKSFAVAAWAQVRWYAQPVLIHPLSGESYLLSGGLSQTDLDDIKHRSFQHFADLLERCGLGKEDVPDWRKFALALWRFGPELIEPKDAGKLGELWKLLPADTRVPDHSIWDHLDLVSAFAGAFAASKDGEAALLALTIGPVQSFIQAARKVEDMWAGSHLLSRMLWEAAKPLCEVLGPDAIIFPRLRGIPLVDLWLRDEMKLPGELFNGCDWRNRPPDVNPLFAAALPNRFVAIVPADSVRELAEKCRDRVRQWTLDLGLRVVDRLLEEAGEKQPNAPRDEAVPAYRQMRDRLCNFPEVYWAATSFALCPPRNPATQRDPDVAPLKQAMAPFYGVKASEDAGFLCTPAWKTLSRQVTLPNHIVFYAPNPGVLYPAIYELTERLLAATKSVRPFKQSRQEGWRCTLSGESEWLTTDRAQLYIPRGQRKSRQSGSFIEGQHVETLWTKIADRQPALAKEGEHLGALPAIKRLWPKLFAEEVKAETNTTERFIVSTHTIALAAQLEQWLEQTENSGKIPEPLKQRLKARDIPSVALPRRIVERFARHPLLEDARRIPAVLDTARESEDDERYAQDQRMVRRLFALASNEGEQKAPRLETYYGLLLMDGDRMGAILSGEAETAITFRESFHPMVREAVSKPELHSALRAYAEQRRPVSPNRHMAISAALNDFSQIIVPYIVEREHAGRLIYAGGDDVLAMLPAAQVLQAAARLRRAYGGSFPEDEKLDWATLRKGSRQLVCKGGFAYLNRRLMRMMGPRATASCGVVIAHHQAPLSFVLRELRQAEEAAKSYTRPLDAQAGRLRDRDAIHVTVIKRSGGKMEVSLDWGEPLKLLEDLRDFLAHPDVSRRAVYLTLEWLDHVPETDGSPDAALLKSMLAYQFKRQSGESAAGQADNLAARLAEQALRQEKPKSWLTNFLCVADFLAREQRQLRDGTQAQRDGQQPEGEAA